jgi:hypothetical protein
LSDERNVRDVNDWNGLRDWSGIFVHHSVGVIESGNVLVATTVQLWCEHCPFHISGVEIEDFIECSKVTWTFKSGCSLMKDYMLQENSGFEGKL